MQLDNRLAEDFQSKLLAELGKTRFPFKGTRVEVANQEYWGLTIYVPSDVATPTKADKGIQKALVNLGVNQDNIAFFGMAEDSDDYEWFCIHPDVPSEIMSKIKSLSENARKESEDEEIYGIEFPKPKQNKTAGDSCFLVMKKDFYEDIEKGYKTTEFRTLNQYYCDKFFGHTEPLKTVKFQLGYNNGPDGKPRQMVFEVKDILLFNDLLDSIPARDENGEHVKESEIPKNFFPTMYGIELGKRIG